MSILLKTGIIASSFKPANNGVLWEQQNWNLTNWGLNDAGGVWINPNTLEFNGFSGNGNTELFQYNDINGVPNSSGMLVELTVQFDVSGGEIVYRVLDVNGNTNDGPDEYFYPQTNGDILTITTAGVLLANLRGVALFNSFGASPPFRVLDLKLVSV